MKRYSNIAISLSLQLRRLKSKYPNSRGYIKRDKLVWYFLVQLDDAYGSYKIKIIYDLNNSPNIYVVDPNLHEITNGLEPPHVYAFNESITKLCLYLPSSGEWYKDKFLSDTVVPWASLWLMYFSGWLATGQWHGGGVHPNTNEQFKKGTVL